MLQAKADRKKDPQKRIAACKTTGSAWNKFRTATIKELKKNKPGLSYAGREEVVRGVFIAFESWTNSHFVTFAIRLFETFPVRLTA